MVAYLPNIPETLVAFLATASLGAVWATCAPEFGPRSVIDRFGIVEPKVLLAIAGYRYGEKAIDRRAEVAEVRAALPTLEHVVHVPYAGGADDALPDAAELGRHWSPSPVHSSLTRSRSTTRSTCCSRPAPPGCRRRSSTATAGSWSSTSRTTG